MGAVRARTVRGEGKGKELSGGHGKDLWAWKFGHGQETAG
jgi:hypothetical protein